jgi:4-amino-4-deoxychorismate lyase
MSLLLETIRFENGELKYIDYHNQRFNRSRNAVFHCQDIWDLKAHIHLPEYTSNQLYKCRVVYGESIKQITFEPYHPNPPRTLQIIEANQINYALKWEDRRIFQELLTMKGNADDVLITQDGYIKDTTYCNVVLCKNGEWFTPESPLLAGTQRHRLLDECKIQKAVIKVSDLDTYEKVRLINSMLYFEEEWEIEEIYKESQIIFSSNKF